MSAITINNSLVHYEKLGRGRPVVLVHSWVGSWRYWVPLMQTLHLKYSVYALDLFGFGDSAKEPTKYDIQNQVEMLEVFLEKMGIPKVALLGHGLGALVATEFAHKHPTHVARMMLIAMPLFEPADLESRRPPGTRVLLTPTLTKTEDKAETLLSIPNPAGSITASIFSTEPGTTSAYSFVEQMKSRTIHQLLDSTFRKSETAHTKMESDVAKADSSVLAKSVVGFDEGRLLDTLHALETPMLMVHGLNDPIVPVPSNNIWEYLTRNNSTPLIPIQLEGIRHFPMLEHEPFPRLATDFLESPDLQNIEVRGRWRRRSR
ncbi:alpha/beta hydrolase [Anaerolineales bacterium]